MKRASILFAKSPVLGKVKTRLISTIGAEKATEIYKRLLLRNICLLENYGQSENYIFASNDKDIAFFEGFSDWRLRIQADAELGERMQLAICDILRKHRYVVLIGADIADAESTDIRDAFAKLESGDDLVIGPSFDGGYWLIGTSRQNSAVFENMPWSTSEVLARTIAAAEEQGLQYSLIATRHDVDTPEDLRFM